MRSFASRVIASVVALIPLILAPPTPAPSPVPPVSAQPVAHSAAGYQGFRATPEFIRVPLPAKDPPQPRPALVVHPGSSLPITSRPGGSTVIGTLPAYSKFGNRMVAWVQELSKSGKYGKITVPYTMNPQTGWIRIAGLKKSHTEYRVVADVSKRRLTLLRSGKRVMTVPTTIGMPSRPTPPGRYHVADRWTSSPSGALGAFVFALSGLQINYPGAESGLFIMAIHGTNSPSTLGQSASNGCLRVGSKPLNRLIPVLRLGTPVIIRP